ASRQDELLRSGSPGRLIVDERSQLYYPAPEEGEHAEPVTLVAAAETCVDQPSMPGASIARVSGLPWWRSTPAARLWRLGALALGAIVLIFVVGRQTTLFEKSSSSVSVGTPAKKDLVRAVGPEPPPRAEISVTSLQTAGPARLLPAVYGVYALSKGQLFELDALRGRVPDPRVHMSAPVGTPSHTVLPDGRVEFII